MDTYAGKHLLIDCYGCRPEFISSEDHLAHVLDAASQQLDMMPGDTSLYDEEGEIILAAFSAGAHICIHAYPDMHYAAINIYCFDSDLNPSQAMKTFRTMLKPEKIRATSVRRGNLDAHPDMRPRIRSKTTALRKIKNTGRQLNATGKKVIGFLRRNHNHGGPQ